MEEMEYKRFSGGTFDSVYQFKVTLKDIEPAVWRRIAVPENYSFWDLHVAIQDAMGWLDCHLHAFFMTEHEDEFQNVFEFADAACDRDDDPETDRDPFLHIHIHVIVENQIEAREPIEAFQFYNAMIRKRCPRHDAIHMIGAILAPLMFLTTETHQSFDLETYKRLLKKYKTRNPRKIFDLLADEPALAFPDENRRFGRRNEIGSLPSLRACASPAWSGSQEAPPPGFSRFPSEIG